MLPAVFLKPLSCYSPREDTVPGAILARTNQIVTEHRRQAAGDGRRQQGMWQVVRDRGGKSRGLRKCVSKCLLAIY